MIKNLAICALLVISAVGVVAQQTAQANPADEISGTYSFLQEGEVLQLTVEDGKLSGYISRYGDSDSDRGQFIEQFFDKTLLEGDRLSFNTKVVHGVGYEFSGVIAIDTGKKVGGEGYRVLRGKLVENSEDANGKTKTRQRQVEFKSFPAEVNR
jgi:hypothetical protein